MPNSEDIREKIRKVNIENDDYGIFHNINDSKFPDLDLFEKILVPRDIDNYYLNQNDIKTGYIINMDGTNSTGYIYLPEELREEDLDRIISIVEEKKDYSYVILKSWIQVTDFITGKEVLDFLGKLKEQLNEKEEKQEEHSFEEKEEKKEKKQEEQYFTAKEERKEEKQEEQYFTAKEERKEEKQDFKEKEAYYSQKVNVFKTGKDIFGSKLNVKSVDELLKLRRAQFSAYESQKTSEPKDVSDAKEDYVEKIVGYDEEGRPIKEVIYNKIDLMDSPPLMAPIGPRQVNVDLGSANFDVNDIKTQLLGRLYGDNGTIYRFNRGFVIVDQDGRKQEEILDYDSRLHHSPEILRMSREDFGVNLNPNPESEIAEYMEATSNGLILILFESSACQIFLPPNITEAQIDQIISEVEPRDFVYDLVAGTSVDDARFGESLSREDVLSFLRRLKDSFKEKDEEKEEVNEEVLAARYSYIRDLLKFTSENGISINQYYTMLGEAIKKGDITGIPEFESTNPFLTADDIIRLINSEDERIVEYFANTMNGVIKLNLEEMSKTNNDNLENNQNIDINPETYIRALLTYIQENEMSLEDYYRSLAIMLRKGDLNSIPSFEQYNPFLNEDDLRRLLDEEDERIVEYFANTMTGVIKLNLEQMSQTKNTNLENNGNIDINPETYIRALLTYIQENEMSLEDYYRSLAIMLRKGDLNSIPSFEQYNPFLNEDDLRRLLDEEDERIVDYFANTMARVIELNLENMNNLNNNQPQNNLNNTLENNDDKFNFNNIDMRNENKMPNIEDDSLELDEMSYLDDKTNYMSGIKITYINTDIINHMNGLAVIREPRSGRINIYGYENDDINLAGKKVIENSANTIESGYYVNLSEYIGILAHGIEDQYGNNSNFAFVNEKGDYLNFYDVINNIMATCRNEGALRYGKEYKEANIGSYEELENQYTGSKGVFKGIELTKGLYVRRDILIDELNKYRVAITKENIDNISHVR